MTRWENPLRATVKREAVGRLAETYEMSERWASRTIEPATASGGRRMVDCVGWSPLDGNHLAGAASGSGLENNTYQF